MRVVLGVLVLAIFPASAGARASHAGNWETQRQSIVCGVARVWGTALDPGTGAPLNGFWPGLQCSAAGIPRPAAGVGDPFVQLGQGRAGRARLVDESQDDLSSGAPPVRLAAGSTWSRAGISCLIGAGSIRCVNAVRHGFTLSPGHVRLF